MAAGKDIAMYERAECVGFWGKHPGIVVAMLVVGGTLVSICKEGRLRTWDLCGPRERGQRTPVSCCGPILFPIYHYLAVSDSFSFICVLIPSVPLAG